MNKLNKTQVKDNIILTFIAAINLIFLAGNWWKASGYDGTGLLIEKYAYLLENHRGLEYLGIMKTADLYLLGFILLVSGIWLFNCIGHRVKALLLSMFGGLWIVLSLFVRNYQKSWYMEDRGELSLWYYLAIIYALISISSIILYLGLKMRIKISKQPE